MQFAMMADSGVSTTHQATVTETFGKPDWNQGMGKQVVWMANQNIRSAEIRLNPAHLGPIEVRIEMEDDQVSLAFSSRHAAVREAVEQALPRLREMFEESGLNLADTDVSQQSFAEQRSHESAENTKHRAQSASGQADPAPGEISAETTTTQSINNGLVDYFI
jgi:flagellar hook-length control protein FliK